MFGLVFVMPWAMLPGLLTQMGMVLGMFFLSIHTYVVHWDEPNLFYAGLMPGVGGFVFLYFWIVNMAEFRELRIEKAKSTNEVAPESEAELGASNSYS